MSDAPIRIGHPDSGFEADICGCCDGTELATLRPTANRPNLTAIAFRAGDHASFKASMLTRLASAAYPELKALGTREDDDFSIALIDAWAAACDVLTFYQERLANEAYIGTATERLSVNELARLIGYRLHPGAAAETDLVILMEDPPAAEPDVTELLVPEGTRIQSQPGPDEMPQVFETIEPLETRVAWNTFRPRLTRPIFPDNGDTSTWLAGLPALQVGDAILIVGNDRGGFDGSSADTGSELWDFRRVISVEPDAANDRTRVTWDRPLGSVTPPGDAAQSGHRFYHLKDRASLFGYNAPHPRMLTSIQRAEFGYTTDPLVIALPGNPPPQPSPSRIVGSATDVGDWAFAHPGTGQIALDAVYKSFVADSWVALTLPTGLVEIYRILDAKDDSEARYGISGKTTRLSFDSSEGLTTFDNDYRRTSVYGGSTEIPFAEHPVTDIVAGSDVELGHRLTSLPAGRKLMFRGKPARVRFDGATTVSITAADGAVQALVPGQEVTLLASPEHIPFTITTRYHLQTDGGFTGTAVVIPNFMRAIPAPDDVSEIAVSATLSSAITTSELLTRLILENPLAAAFDRASLRIHANVARAAHGEGVTDILGSGDPSRPFQKFTLKQAPVTHRVAPTETGVESTLTLRVDGAEWQEVPDLHDRGPTARVYKTSLTDAGETVIEFGDGISGARPTPGRDNIVAEHSKGLGRAGNLRAGQLTLPLDRPLGLKETLNPLPATGGADPEAHSEARRNAPIYTLTLGRVVSLTDYRDFALGFPGIAKAESRWVWQGETRRIVVTVAGPEGAEVPEGSTTHTNLLNAFRSLGDPLVGVDLLSYAPAFFRLGLRVAVDSAHDPETVLPAAEATLRSAFAFETRDFAQTLALSEIAAAAHTVPGLTAIDVDLLARSQPPQTAGTAHARLVSHPSRRGADGTLLPAEILTLHPGPLQKLEVMA
ncbi:putative baseplate assembly protein [Algicella marina]|uniref:Putative baseplate assembly protein n=1 Tax=Algicella marina TaxID=2683284 RepID=A0A6P1T3T2_9RHOB|nr:putative baseplate assembly protein [Algicella marina]QHQ36667.1 putative baseplate assembly protein [Algicella marina]